MRRRITTFLILLFFLLLISLPAIYIKFQMSTASTNPMNPFYREHVLGGFSIKTPELAVNASKEDIQIAFEYGEPPLQSSQLGRKLESLHMKVIDGYISSYLYYYECNRIRILRLPLVGAGQYCRSAHYPNVTSANALLTTIATHLKQVKDNHLVIGYWVLDDWVQMDAGSAKSILMKIHQLIQYYTPGRPAICGFGGGIGLRHQYSWHDWIAENFSPQGCDMVGFYIYTPSLPNTIPPVSPDAYNWSMQGLLPAMFASLQRRGWSISKEPLIGIGQAFGGPIAHTNRYWVTPTAKDIETQSRSFCEHGASGLTFYAWDDSGFGPGTKSPMNSPQIATGIRNGIAACKQYWERHPSR